MKSEIEEKDHYTTKVKLISLRRKIYGRHHDLVDRYEIFVSQMTMDMFRLS